MKKLLMVFLLLSLLTPALANEVVVCNPDHFKTFDLHQSNDFVTDQLLHTVFEPLLILTPTGVKPNLVEKFEPNPSFSEWVLTLKPGVKFHSQEHFKPTRSMNAFDVEFSLKRQMPGFGYTSEEEKNFIYFSQRMLPLLKSIQVIDALKLKLTLHFPIENFPRYLANATTAIYSLEYYQFLKSNNKMPLLATHPIGTGPWSYQPKGGNIIPIYKLTPFAQHHAQKVNFSLKFIFDFTASKMFERVSRGECDWVNGPAPEIVKAIKEMQGYELHQLPSSTFSFLLVNNLAPRLSDKLMRQNILLCFDANQLSQKSFLGYGKPASNIFPESDRFYSKLLPPHITQSESARSYFKLNPLPALKVIYPLEPRPYLPYPRESVTELSRQLEMCGLTTDLIPKPIAEINKIKAEDDYSLLVFGDTEVDFNLIASFLKCAGENEPQTYTGYCTAEFQQLVRTSRNNFNPNDEQKRDVSMKIRLTHSYFPFMQVPTFTIIRENKKEILVRSPFFQSLLISR